MTVTTPPATDRGTPPPPGRSADRAGERSPLPESRVVDWRRLRSRVAGGALVALFVAAVGQALGTVVAGRLAAGPSGALVGLLALCVVGAAVLDSAARVVWSGVVDRAEGRLRADLLDAALQQPLARLGDQAVGEVLDRVDDDTYEVGVLVRRQVWDAMRTLFATVPMWVVAGLTWWPAWFLLPVVTALTVGVVRPLLPEISRRKVLEEMAWTDHAAALEEGIAGRDDLRTSLGQAHVVRRVAALSAEVHRRLGRVLEAETRLARRAGLLLHALLAAVVVSGVALVAADGLSVARLVTLFLVTSTFVGQVNNLAQHLPDLQAGLGALIRLRQLLESEPEPVGGHPVPDGPLDLRFRDLHFSYEEGRFALEGVDLAVPAGETCALVGRTGSGKSTLAALVSRAVEPERGTVLLGGVDVLDLDLQQLRATVGVVTQRTEILAGTLADNITLFADVPAGRVEHAVAELGLEAWVAGLPEGLATPLGPGGTTLSAGEEQLVAFARLLVRDVRVVVLDEATARMDPVTEELVVRAADRLLARRTGLLVAHRLGTVERAGLVAVLEQGRVVQQGPHTELAAAPGRFRDLLRSGGAEAPEDARDQAREQARDAVPAPDPAAPEPAPDLPAPVATAVGGRRRSGPPPVRPEVGDGPSLTRGTAHLLVIHPAWGLAGAVLFLAGSLTGAFGTLTGWAWGRLVTDLGEGRTPVALTVVVVVSLFIAPLTLAAAFRRYPHWWVAVLLRTRMSVLVGQTRQKRLARTPPGEVVARTMDADRYARYADRWVDFVNGLIIVAATSIAGGSLLAGGVLLAVMVASALASSVGRPIAGRSAAAASKARAGFGRSLVSVLDCVRTVKLAAATPDVRRHLGRVDSGRVDAAVREHRVQAALDGVPVVVVQCGVVAAWAVLVAGGWELATALLVASAVNGFDWFGRVAGSVITEAPGTRSWQRATSRLAGGVDLMDLPPGVDLVAGTAPEPPPTPRVPLQRLELRGVDAVHDDGTLGVTGVDLDVEAGQLVLLLGQVGSGKSSLLASLAGLVDHRGSIRWNGQEVEDAELFLRPGQVAHVAQVPRVLSGTFADNVLLDHTGERGLERAVADARLRRDVEEAGGPHALVGHRGVRLSGGQVQRLALARALATDAELLLADDVSSALDAATELELWEALRRRGTTVVGATSKRAALARADQVVVLVDGRVEATGPWSELSGAWGHLAG